MRIIFKVFDIDAKEKLQPYFERANYGPCEYNFNLIFMWDHLYKTRYHIEDDFIVFAGGCEGDESCTIMPLCTEQNRKKAFEFIYGIFKDKNKPFKMVVTTKEYAGFVEENYKGKFKITSNREDFDYIYLADSLRTFKGKKMRKKRNHLNFFMREYGARYEYKTIGEENFDDCLKLLREWNLDKEVYEEDEEIGIKKILQYYKELDVKIGGIYIDDTLKAFSIGSYYNQDTALIHVEKADADIRGLYPAITQEFLVHEFPSVTYVNREEDMGIEGLRKSKLSYQPHELLEKYTIEEL